MILNSTGDGLRILEDGLFIHDVNLPKFQKRKAASPKLAGQAADFAAFGTGSIFNEAWQDDSSDNSISADRAFRVGLPRPNNRPPTKKGFLSRIASWFSRAAQPAEQYEVMSVEEFFHSVKNSAEELVIVDRRAAGFIAAMKQAKKNGQTALLEKYRIGLDAARGETQLAALGLTQYITEAKVVEFVKKSSKGLRLDLIQNFTRIIPEAVSNKKNAADERDIFDNYAVLHYDPQSKSYSQTEAEKAVERARKRDPILFGMILGRRQLYFVADWQDELCDLTLDQIADVLGKDGIQEIPTTTAMA